MKKIVLIINIILVFILLGIGFCYFSVFLKKGDNVKSDYKEIVDNVFMCENYDNKIYTEEKIENWKCYKIDFQCNKCLVYDIYFENKIIYRTKENINIYDLLNKKNIESIELKDDSEKFYADNNKVKALSYFNKNNEQTFYNIEKNKHIKVDNQVDVCDIRDYDTYNGNSYCSLDNYEDVIHNDRIVVEKNGKFGLLNLNTGKFDIPMKYSHLEYDYRYDFNENNETVKIGYYLASETNVGSPDELFDSNAKLLYKSVKGEYFWHIIKDYLFKDVLLTTYDDDFYILDETGKTYSNSKLTQNVINSKIYNKIENKEYKSKFDGVQIFYNDEQGTGYEYYYDSSTRTIYMDFSYTNSYYEIYVNIHYKYNLEKKVWEEYEYNECEHTDCSN